MRRCGRLGFGVRGRQAEPLRQADALRLAGGALGQRVEEHDPARALEIRQLADDELGQHPLVDAAVRAQHDGCADILAQPRVGQGEDDRLRDRWMLQQHVLDFARPDLFAAAIDDLLGAAGDEQVAVVVEVAAVAGAEPTIGEGALIG